MKKKTVINLLWIFISVIASITAYLLFDFGVEYRSAEVVAAIAILMSLLWITEAIPLSVTSLIPLILFPFTGTISAVEISQTYVNSTIFLFLGGFIIAIAMERWNLHKRIAINVINVVGTSNAKIVLGFMLSSAFISMWISNTATAVMLLPIGLAVINRLEDELGVERTSRFAIALMLGIAYSCSIGGIATPIGTPPNLVFQRIYKINFPDNPEIYFGEWMKFAVPTSVIMLIFVWILLTKILYKDKFGIKIDKEVINQEKNKLGKIRYEEKVVLIIFIVTSLLWIFRAELNLGFFKIYGWSNLFPKSNYIDDGTIAITMATLLFIIPVKKENKEQNFILDYTAVNKIPWDIILLFGGGFALAEGFVSSKLSELIGKQFISLKNIDVIFLIAAVCFVLTFLTELTSNTATAQILLPILAAISKELQINPLILMLPATLSVSFAFMLPVATPPNAIVFSSRRLKIIDMAKTGIFINFFGIIVVTFIVWLFFV
ncbi:SLC13 family permease [Rosettibacter firmus]|uniref:SLC13 family permease n=1 Tax=Rosettibacter firmus TaxID=3111522 RepID=UPI00336C0273